MVDVQLTQLSKHYGDNAGVYDVDLVVPDGSFVTLLGPSGCGKTTTLRSIAGLEEPDGGSIRIGDRTVVDVAKRVFVQPERRKVGMVFQSYALWPHMTVAQNIAYPLKRRGASRSEVDAEVGLILDLVNLSTQRDRSVAALSGGQQQRVALARAMVGHPVLTLFDEPLSNLDVKLRVRMRNEIRALHDRVGMTSVYVTHDQEEALALSDLVVVMNQGRIQQVGSPQDIYERPANAFVADFVGYENRLPSGKVAGVGKGEIFVRAAAMSLDELPGMVKVASGTVLDGTYLGTAYEYRVKTADGILTGRVPARGADGAIYATGDTVSVYVDPARAVVLPADAFPGAQAIEASDPTAADAVEIEEPATPRVSSTERATKPATKGK
ncbi:MAG: transporter ATP-binding protein [Microbacteriaceae bacterium]|nr:transporter ATP-binding protein [Microbacteriaceae bacterium]